MPELIYKAEKTEADINELLIQHKNLIYFMLSKMGQLSNQDAESAAWEALWDAIGTYSVYDKAAFSTYACKCLANAINCVLRKQQRDRLNYIELSELTDANTLFTTDDYESAEVMLVVSTAFDSYIRDSRGITRDVLLLWRSSEFSMCPTELAAVCKTSASYVTRIQSSFRAFLSSKLER